jgi:hypothetical protein
VDAEDVVGRDVTSIAERLRIQVCSAWHHSDAAVLADGLAEQARRLEAGAGSGSEGAPPMPLPGNPELALILAGVPDATVETGGDLYGVILNAVVNAWMAGHFHGEDGCEGCEGARGEAGHDGGSADGSRDPDSARPREVVRPDRRDPGVERLRIHRRAPLTFGIHRRGA